MSLRQILKKLDEQILGIKSQTPSDYALKNAKGKGVKRLYESNTKKIQKLENKKSEIVNKPNGFIISSVKARQIASGWQDDSYDGLASIASTGKYFDEMYEMYIKEINDDLKISNSSELKQLKKWVEYKHWESQNK